MKACEWCERTHPGLEYKRRDFWVTEKDPRNGKTHQGWKSLGGWFCPDDREAERFCFREYVENYGGESHE